MIEIHLNNIFIKFVSGSLNQTTAKEFIFF